MKPLALLPGMFVVAPATTAGPVAGAIIAEINGSEPTLFTEVSRSEAPPAFTPASKPVQLHTGAAGGGGALSGISAAEAAPNAPNEIAEAIAHPRKRFIKNPQSKINLRQVSAYPPVESGCAHPLGFVLPCSVAFVPQIRRGRRAANAHPRQRPSQRHFPVQWLHPSRLGEDAAPPAISAIALTRG